MLEIKLSYIEKTKEMTQNDLADILEVSAGTVSKYESGSFRA